MMSTTPVADDEDDDDTSYKTQEKEEENQSTNEFPESPDDARYLTTVMEDEDEEGDNADDEEVVSMPLFQYYRLFGSLPRAGPGRSATPLSKRRYCSAIGKVILSSEMTTTTTTSNEADRAEATTAGTLVSPDLWQQHPVHVAAYGFENGQLLVVDAVSGVAVAEPEKFQVREGRNSHAIIALSWDASGTFLAALDDGGMCAIFEMKYSIQMRDADTSLSASEQASGNVFTNLMSALTGGGNSGQTRAESATRSTQLVPTLTVSTIQVHRIPYPNSFGKPTCLALDPAYRKRREKSVIVGFADGRLVLTRRGFVFQRRSDAVIYQAVKDDDFTGIEAIAWRGPLVAWADTSGVRLLDVDALQRIAHIDRPSGARSSLYPTVSQVHPSLCFETENDLLVAWGDCLLSLNIREVDGIRASSVSASESSTVVAQRRRVECKMAWELDCIACGVVPIDSKHIAVLGLVPASSDEGSENDSSHENGNDIELQVISRVDGAVVFADLIPLVRADTQSHSHYLESSKDFHLLSSFSVPRMDNTSELQEMENLSGSTGVGAFDPIQGSMFGKTSNSAARFRDSHVVWGLEQVVVEDENILFGKDAVETKKAAQSDDNSVDSDDYDFTLDSLSDSILDVSGDSDKSIPPIMILASSHDILLTRTRDVDDAVSYALEKEKYALALNRALQHVRRLRRYNIDELTNEYFRALLRISDAPNSSISETRPLSIRRLKIAAKWMPILLGGNADLWTHWLKELEKLPGGLFVVRNVIPVRDPKLGREVYNRMIESMLAQVHYVKASAEAGKLPQRLESEAEQQFLLSLLSWGTTRALNEFVHLFDIQLSKHSFIKDIFQEVVISQKRRREQTAANYLNFTTGLHEESTGNPSAQVNNLSEIQDSLYDLDQIAAIIEERVSLERLQDNETSINSKFALEAIAVLSMMKGNFKAMLVFYMTLGILHNPLKLEDVEERALSSLSSTGNSKTTVDGHQERYEFVISLIKNHHLHEFILDEGFLPARLNKTPLEALVMLVGLECLGNFLCEHCAAPQNSTSSASKRIKKGGKMEEQRIGTLPIDLVARQLERRPKLLHWYLHLIFKNRPELYIRFPTTSVPPSTITNLHRRHLELHISYAGASRDSSKVFDGIEPYKTVDVMTPFLAFLKAVLPLGGVSPVDVGKMLDEERKRGPEESSVFALELAYIMEHFGNDSTEDVAMVLELYLKGARSLVLAVSYAQRAGKHSLELWHTLVEHCLSPDAGSRSGSDGTAKENSSLFGSLLEAAALSGADVALLVNQIPHGMAVEGLRPRLVAAVADYRLQLQMHESASKIATSERAVLLSEYSHRSRRGFRCSATPNIISVTTTSGQNPEGNEGNQVTRNGGDLSKVTFPWTRRPKIRSDHQSLGYSLPLR